MQRLAALSIAASAVSVVLAFIGLPLTLGVSVDFFNPAVLYDPGNSPANGQIPAITLAVTVFFMPSLLLASLALRLSGLAAVQREGLREIIRLLTSGTTALGCLMVAFMLYIQIYNDDVAGIEIMRRSMNISYMLFFILSTMTIALIGLGSYLDRTLPRQLSILVIVGGVISLAGSFFLVGDFPLIQRYNVVVLVVFITLLSLAAYWGLVTSRP